jgi:hypothetical protein
MSGEIMMEVENVALEGNTTVGEQPAKQETTVAW